MFCQLFWADFMGNKAMQLIQHICFKVNNDPLKSKDVIRKEAWWANPTILCRINDETLATFNQDI